MKQSQAGILAPLPKLARYLSFSLPLGRDPREALKELATYANGENIVVGLGSPLINSLGVTIGGLRPIPVIEKAKVDIPSTPFALWCWLRGEDRGMFVHQTHELEEILGDAFTLEAVADGFLFADSRDLSGYVDGTENPKDDGAVAAALVGKGPAGMVGSSFVAVQEWEHDLPHFMTMDEKDQDNIIGRRKSDNEEFDDAPPSAHVKRAAQESYVPEAFVLRRSMPWSNGESEGLMFVAFGKSLDAFEAVLTRMSGAEDGVVDGLFNFTRPLTGATFWCPPMADGRLDLRLLKL